MAMLRSLLALAVWLACTSVAAAQSSSNDRVRSVALVIGQARYVSAPPLTNPTHDAAAMASTLHDLGFEVVQVLDGGRAPIEAAVQSFLAKARSAEIAFVYYAGHGIQRGGTNYIVPVDARTDPGIDFDRDFVSITALLDRLEAAVPAGGAKIVVLDACRDNPWEAIATAQTGASSRGLAPPTRTRSAGGGPGTDAASAGYFRIVAFSTAAGQTAADGEGRHSPYTRSLLRFLPQQGLEVGEIFRQAAADVQKETKGVQRPEYLVQTSRPLYLRVPYVTDCDRAAIEGQNFLGLPGIPFDDIDPKAAIPACEAALKELPNSARLHNNMGRAYEKAERLAEALRHYEVAANAGYAPAINAYGIMKLAGCGLPAPQIEDGIRLIVEARSLGNLSARASLTSHDILKFVGEGGIRRLQDTLGRQGFYRGRPTGKDEAGVAAALAAFQEAKGLARKGLTLETVHALGVADIVPKRFRCH